MITTSGHDCCHDSPNQRKAEVIEFSRCLHEGLRPAVLILMMRTWCSYSPKFSGQARQPHYLCTVYNGPRLVATLDPPISLHSLLECSRSVHTAIHNLNGSWLIVTPDSSGNQQPLFSCRWAELPWPLCKMSESTLARHDHRSLSRITNSMAMTSAL